MTGPATAVTVAAEDAGGNVPSAVSLARRLSMSERLRRRRFEILPLTGPGAAFTEVQGRAPGETTAPAALADLVTSIANVGVLQPVLVEEQPSGGRLLVAGERRLRACKWGAVAEPDNPHFGAIPAIVCPGPLSEEERRTWQLVENLAREDLRPGELGAALLFERCALLATKLLGAGVAVPQDVLCLDDPVARYRALEKLRAARPHVGAPWADVLRRLGIQMSERQARAVVAAFASLPPEVSADFDAHRVALTTRQTYLRLDTGRRAAAEELWAAVKAAGRPTLLGAAVREKLACPTLDPEDAVGRAGAAHDAANQARAERLRTRHGGAADGGTSAVPTDVVARTLGGLVELLEHLRAGRRLGTYDSGSLRLHAEELLSLVDEGGERGREEVAVVKTSARRQLA